MLSLNACILARGLGFTGNDRKQERLGQMADMFSRRTDLDVVLLQEAWEGGLLPRQLDGFYRACRRAGWWVIATQPAGVMNSGNVILSRHRPEAAGAHTFRSTQGWQRLLPNGALHACISSPRGRRLHLFTAHLQSATVPYASPLNQSCEKIRAQQCAELKHHIDTTAGTDRWVVAGDFNIDASSREYARLVAAWGVPSLLQAGGSPPTYNDHSFLAPPGWRRVGYAGCIDHVFTNAPGARLRRVHTQPDISDHYGVEFSVPS